LANTLNLAQAEGDGVPLPNLGIDFGGGNNEVRYASPYLARPLGALEPIVLGPGQVSVEFVGYTGSTFCWQAGLPETLVREVKLQDGSWIPRTEYVGRIHGPLSATRWRNDGGEIVEIHGRRAVACN